MKSLKLSQALSILAIALAASIIPACGPTGLTTKLSAFQQPPIGPTIHQASAVGPFSVPVTASAGGTMIPVKTWTFTPASGEEFLRFRISGEEVYAATGQAQVGSQQASIVLSITDGQGFIVGISTYEPLPMNGTVKPFYLDGHPDWSSVRTPATFPSAGPYVIAMCVYTYPYWSGNIQNLQLEVLTAPFTAVANSPQLQ